MATTITAPVPVTHSGESDPAQYPQVIAGQQFPDIVGASTTAAGNIKVAISSGEANVDVEVTVVAAANAYTTANKLKYTAAAPGLYTVTVTDVTAGEVATTKVQVFGSEGV